MNKIKEELIELFASLQLRTLRYERFFDLMEEMILHDRWDHLSEFSQNTTYCKESLNKSGELLATIEVLCAELQKVIEKDK